MTWSRATSPTRTSKSLFTATRSKPPARKATRTTRSTRGPASRKPCGLTLKDKVYADLTGLARMKWVSKMSGFHQIRPMIKLADGTMLVGDKADGSRTDWLESDFSLADVKWMKMDIKRLVTTGFDSCEPRFDQG